MDSRHPPVRLRFPSQPEGWRGETALTRVALEAFARRAWLNPAARLKLAELGLSSGATSYLESLRRRGLLIKPRAPGEEFQRDSHELAAWSPISRK